MKSIALFITLSFTALAGCASAPAPAVQTVPSVTASAPSRDWVSGASGGGEDFEFTQVGSPKAKAGAVDAPTVMKVDSACGHDVKTTHLNAAAH